MCKSNPGLLYFKIRINFDLKPAQIEHVPFSSNKYLLCLSIWMNLDSESVQIEHVPISLFMRKSSPDLLFFKIQKLQVLRGSRHHTLVRANRDLIAELVFCLDCYVAQVTLVLSLLIQTLQQCFLMGLFFNVLEKNYLFWKWKMIKFQNILLISKVIRHVFLCVFSISLNSAHSKAKTTQYSHYQAKSATSRYTSTASYSCATLIGRG